MPQLTWDSLTKHISHYGMDNYHKGYNAGKPVVYTTYRAFREDSCTKAARDHFGPDTYVAFVEKYGQHGWADDARKDHAAVRATSDAEFEAATGRTP